MPHAQYILNNPIRDGDGGYIFTISINEHYDAQFITR